MSILNFCVSQPFPRTSRLLVESSFCNIVEVNQLETVSGEEGIRKWEGKRKTNIVWFVSYVCKLEGELLQGEWGQGAMSVISMNISKI